MRLVSFHAVAGTGALMVLLGTLIGCGDGRLKVYSVTGQVLYNGQPLKGVDIAFHPTDAKNDTGYPPHGKTDAEGKFVLTTYLKDDGAPAGEFKVAIAIAFAVETAGGDDGSDQTKRLTFQVPKQYLHKDSTPFTVVLKTESNTLEPFKLEGPPVPKGLR